MKIIHDSDCAVHNEPAYPNGPCNCGVEMVEALESTNDNLRAELRECASDLSLMTAERDALKAYAAKADIELGNLEDKLREAHAMSATLSHAARVSHRWEQAEIDKVKARVRAALEEPK